MLQHHHQLSHTVVDRSFDIITEQQELDYCHIAMDDTTADYNISFPEALTKHFQVKEELIGDGNPVEFIYAYYSYQCLLEITYGLQVVVIDYCTFCPSKRVPTIHFTFFSWAYCYTNQHKLGELTTQLNLDSNFSLHTNTEPDTLAAVKIDASRAIDTHLIA